MAQQLINFGIRCADNIGYYTGIYQYLGFDIEDYKSFVVIATNLGLDLTDTNPLNNIPGILRALVEMNDIVCCYKRGRCYICRNRVTIKNVINFIYNLSNLQGRLSVSSVSNLLLRANIDISSIVIDEDSFNNMIYLYRELDN